MEKERKWICAAVAILIAGIVTGMTIYRQSVLVEAKVEKTQEKLGDKFKDKDFHEALLKSGSAPFSVVQSNVDEYIKNAK